MHWRESSDSYVQLILENEMASTLRGDLSMSLATGIVGCIIGFVTGLIAALGPILCGVFLWEVRKIRPLMIGAILGMFLGALVVAPPSSRYALYAAAQVSLFLLALACCWGRAWLKARYSAQNGVDG